MYYQSNRDGVLQCVGDWKPMIIAKELEQNAEVVFEGKKLNVNRIVGGNALKLDVFGFQDKIEVIVTFSTSMFHVYLKNKEKGFDWANNNPVLVMLEYGCFTVSVDCDLFDDSCSWAEKTIEIKKELAQKICEKFNFLINERAKKVFDACPEGMVSFVIEEKY